MSIAAVLMMLSVAAPPTTPHFCADSRECRVAEACVAGVCEALSDPSVQLLFPVAVDRLFDLDVGSRTSPVVDRLYKHLRSQMAWSGFFRVLGEGGYPPHRGLERLGRTTVDLQAWHEAGAYAVLKGELKRVDGEIVLTLRLYLTELGRAIHLPMDVQRLPSADPRTLKLAAARWVDSLVLHFTGKPGVSSTRLAYARRMKRGGAKEIGVMDLDGGFERAITNNGSINVLPAWTADGRIAFTSFKANNPDLYIGGRKFSSRPRMNTGASFNRDGKRVALTLSRDGNPEIYILDAKTGQERRRVTTHRAIDTSPTWSPDGRQLAFVSDRLTGRPQIMVVSLDGGEPYRPVQVGGYNTGPDWSPVGPTILYSATMGAERYQIFAIDLAAKVVRRLTKAGSNEEPCFSADGRYIAFTSDRGGRRAVWVMTADGRQQRQVSRGAGEYYTPAWERPRLVRVAPGPGGERAPGLSPFVFEAP